MFDFLSGNDSQPVAAPASPSWRDEWQQGSWRGVIFHLENAGGDIGRRKAVHEYPQRDLPYVADMGRKARRYEFTVFLHGKDLLGQRNALEAAIEQRGPGTLIHPYYGALQVECLGAQPSYNSKQGGVINYRISFVEAGQNQFPKAAANTRHKLSAAVATGLAANHASLFSRLKTEGPGFLFDSAKGWMQNGTTLLLKLNNKRTWLTDVGGLTSDLTRFADSLTSTLQLPAAMGDQLASIMGQLMGAGRALTGSNSYDNAQPIGYVMESQRSLSALPVDAIPTTTPTRIQQAENQQAINDWFKTSATLLAADAIAEASAQIDVTDVSQSPFDSYEHAINVRDELLDALDEIANTTPSDDVYQAVGEVQTLLLQHIEAHGFKLPRIQRVTLNRSEPALMVAYRLYGDASRADDIISRNKISHPLFVPAGEALEMLSDGAANG